MEEKIDFFIGLMRSRAEYLVNNRPQHIDGSDIKKELLELNRTIKKYSKIKDNNLELIKSYSLSEFGFEIEGEPEL